MGNELFISVREAATRLNVGIGFIYNLLYSKRLTARKVGKEWRISVASVEDRLKQRKKVTA